MGFYIEAPTRKYRKDNRLTIILIKKVDILFIFGRKGIIKVVASQ